MWSESPSVVSDSLQPHGWYSPWNSPGQNTGVGSLSLLQGIFPTQESDPGLPHCRWILYQLSHKGNWRILGWVAYPFSSRSSPPRNQTGVSCIAGRFFTNWAIREALIIDIRLAKWETEKSMPRKGKICHPLKIWLPFICTFKSHLGCCCFFLSWHFSSAVFKK